MFAPAASQAAGVQVYFPDAIQERLRPGFGTLAVERVTLQLRPLDGLNNVMVARAIASKKPMSITEAGLLVPDAIPTVRLAPSIERRVRGIAPVTATIEIRWILGQTHPQVFCLDPRIDIREEPGIPHVYLERHPTEGVNAICPYPPHYRLFDPSSMTGQYHLVHSVACWVANYLIWKATRHWVGPQASHSKALIQAQFADSDCFCRSGRPLTQCCGRSRNLPGVIA